MTGTTTLTTEPTAGILATLLSDAARTQELSAQRRHARIANPPSGDQPPPNSPEFWADFRDLHLAVSPETGRLLYLLARSAGARSIVEFGTSFGVSTIHLAAAVRDNGGGRVIGTEFEASKAASTNETLTAAGLADLVEIRVGDALETLRTDLPAPIDLVLLDGTKTVYLDVLTLLETDLAPNAVVIADNAARSPEYLEHVRNGGAYFSVAALAEDVEISLRLG